MAAAGLVYDLLVRAAELPAAIETARRRPALRFVVDHLAKPPLRTGDLTAWAAGVASLAELPNVVCKISGLVTEADPGTELVPYIERALRWFGPERCMFGSDWPVCLLAAGYGDVLRTIRDGVPERDRDTVFAGAAVRTYGLEP